LAPVGGELSSEREFEKSVVAVIAHAVEFIEEIRYKENGVANTSQAIKDSIAFALFKLMEIEIKTAASAEFKSRILTTLISIFAPTRSLMVSK
jgi:hypothetical protein